MEIGIHYIDFLPNNPERLASTLAATAKAAEDVGATMFSLGDHFFQVENLGLLGVTGIGQAEDPYLEGYTSLGFLAGQTSTITLAMLVTGVTYRNPGVLAKTISTLDILSQGRATLGIGAAWYQREHLALGIPYPSARTRLEMLEETLQICKQMWSPNNGAYTGRHYHLTETICEPQPQGPLPILVGGDGNTTTLLAAQYGDAWNSVASPEQLPHKLDTLRRHCDAIGRDFATLRLTAGLFTNPFDDLDNFLSTLERYAALGIELVNVGPYPGDPDPEGFVRRLGQRIIPVANEFE